MTRRAVGGHATDVHDTKTLHLGLGLLSNQPPPPQPPPHTSRMAGQRESTECRRPKRRRTNNLSTSRAICALLVGSLPTSFAQSCISLAGSSTCSAFNASSISTDSALVGLFPFLSSVTDLSTFDSGLTNYIASGFATTRYSTLIGCSNYNSDNTTDFYARYTTSVLCNAIVQNSITPCSLSGAATRPLCADSCAEYAQSEEEIVASDVCGTAGSGALTQIRADFTDCALPADSLTGTCIEAVDNQPDNCGFSSNLASLCSYCAASSPNATDSCCVFSNSTSLCRDVTLPIVASSALQPVTVTQTTSMGSSASSKSSSSNTSTPAAVAAAHRGLTGGQIAGIVIGAVLGALVLLGLLIGACLLLRRRRDSSPATSVFNQPATTRSQPMTYNDGARDQERAGLAVLPGGRVARMAALEGSSSSERHGPAYTALGGYRKSTSDEEYTPESRRAYGLAPPPKRSGSLSSGSQLAAAAAEHSDTSPSTQNDYTSPESQNQSEQLHFFKDYYSQDEIHESDIVSTLWAYEPRAPDEFSLERGDMIKVLGIWDDGWATGVRIRQKADDWRPDDKLQRDSGMSNGRDAAEGEGEVKAFPLVCVCLPQHWRKTIEGDSTEGSGQRYYPELP